MEGIGFVFLHRVVEKEETKNPSCRPMAYPQKSVLVCLSLSILLLCSVFGNSEEDEDLSFLEEPKPPSYAGHEHDNFQSQFAPPSFDDDDKDVVALNGSEFADFIGKNKYVLVEFYAPWCGHCQSLAPEYAAAAKELKAEGSQVVLAKVDATVEAKLADDYKVEGYPTLYLFVDADHRPYNGPTKKEAIVAWLKKKTGPGVHNVTTADEAHQILTTHSKIVVAFLDTLTGHETKELEAASQLEDDVDFYQTSSPDVANIFQVDPISKRPALVLLKKEAEKLTTHVGEFSKSAILEFISTSKFPLVMNFSRETGPIIFEHPIKKQVMLFATANESDKCLPAFEEASKSFKGKLVFVYVERDNEDYGIPMVDYFGIPGTSPKLLAYTGVVDGKKFLLDTDLNVETIKSFAANFLADKLEPFYKSDPIPEDNKGLVKIVVGKNFDEIVLDESKDVILEIYAPWCPHCHALERPYNRLALHLSDIDSIVVAKMDGTTNEHPRAKSDGFPTIHFFQAGNKTSEPITFDGDRSAVELYKFIKKHASIPFKITNPISSPDTQPPTIESETTSGELKDEL